MDVKCVAMADAIGGASRFLALSCPPLSRVCNVSYTFPTQPLMLGTIELLAYCCSYQVLVIDTVMKNVLYTITYDQKCCKKTEFKILDANKTVVGTFGAVF